MKTHQYLSDGSTGNARTHAGSEYVKDFSLGCRAHHSVTVRLVSRSNFPSFFFGAQANRKDLVRLLPCVTG